MLQLFSHPFSSYCQKVLVALWEKEIPFTYRNLEEPNSAAERASLWPLGRFPVLLDGSETVVESSIIIEHLDLRHEGPIRLIPEDKIAALEVRFMDRCFDNYVMDVMSKPVFEAIKGEAGRKEAAMAEAAQALDIAYAWLEDRLKTRTWAAGGDFTMADCAAAPSLFYADWVHGISPEFGRLREYRAQLLERPSFARAVEEARPYRSYFPLGAPDRD
ncbi:MAG TPA: glutathione S-transferase family protein [Allosphingosinicella sp.]